MEEELIFQVSGPWVGFCAIASSTRTNNSHAKETLPKGVFLQPNNQNTTFTFPYAFLDWSIASKIHELKTVVRQIITNKKVSLFQNELKD